VSPDLTTSWYDCCELGFVTLGVEHDIECKREAEFPGTMSAIRHLERVRAYPFLEEYEHETGC
jgi:hypothetical protein